MATAIRDAGQCLSDAGYLVEEVDPPALAAIADDWKIMSRAEARDFLLSSVHEHGAEDIKKRIIWLMENAPPPDFKAYSLALSRRTGWIRQWAMFMRDYPLVLCPVSLGRPFLQGADAAGETEFNEIIRVQAPSFALPVLGLPGVSVPTGVVGGLPTGVQIVGRRFREDMILDAAEAVEACHPMATHVDPRS